MFYRLHLKAVQHWQSKNSYNDSKSGASGDKNTEHASRSDPCEPSSSEPTTSSQQVSVVDDPVPANYPSATSCIDSISQPSPSSTHSGSSDQLQHQENPSQAEANGDSSLPEPSSPKSQNIQTELSESPLENHESVFDTEKVGESSKTSGNHSETTISSSPGLSGTPPTRTLEAISESDSIVGVGWSFRQFYGSLADLSKTSEKVIRRRLESIKYLEPDEDFFRDLENVEEWDPSQQLPPHDELTSNDIARIKKGMINGKLYNMGFDWIQKVFPPRSLKVIKQNTDDFRSKKLYRCPLCPRAYRKYGVLEHIESMHTMSRLRCEYCGRISTSKRSAFQHHCHNTGEHLFGSSSSESLEEISSELKGSQGSPVSRKRGRNRCNTEPEEWESDGSACFKRYFGSILGCVIPRGSPNMYRRRLVYLQNLNPDSKIFKGLDDVKRWSSKRRVPSPDHITPNQSMRIKKGMMNGKLYNLSYQQLAKIFPDFSRVKRDTGPSRAGGENCRQLRCPLCSKAYKRRCDVLSHMGNLHTMYWLICSNCNTIYTNKDSYKKHRCSTTIH